MVYIWRKWHQIWHAVSLSQHQECLLPLTASSVADNTSASHSASSLLVVEKDVCMASLQENLARIASFWVQSTTSMNAEQR